MSRIRKLFRLGLLITGLLLVAGSSAFVAQKALAGGCFTDVADGSFWYDVTCWMKTRGISTGYADGTYKPDNYVTRGEMALFIQRAFTNASLVTQINTGPSAWVANATYSPGAFVEHGYAWAYLKAASSGTYQYIISPSLPSSLYNTMMYVKGIKICLNAVDYPEAYITQVDVVHLTYFATGDGYGPLNWLQSTTDLTATGCYVYNFTNPSNFWGANQVTIDVTVQINNPSAVVPIGVVTVILQPSTYSAVLGSEVMETGSFEDDDIVPIENDPASNAP